MMIHLTAIAWAQFILIEVGVLFQLVAVCAVIKQTSAYRRMARLPQDEEMADDGQVSEEMECESMDQAGTVQADSMPEERIVEEARAGAYARNVTQTTKVQFVQKFDFRRHGICSGSYGQR
jgi:D-serine deaminase-like pyridoxal phosphate-dependent protein